MNYGALRNYIISEKPGAKIDTLYSLECSKVRDEREPLRVCSVSPFNNVSYKLYLNNVWSRFKELFTQSGQVVINFNFKIHQRVPGWKSYMKHMHELTKQAFFSLRKVSSLINGMTSKSTCSHRASFKAMP